MKKAILLILVILLFATILYLTFQDGEHTAALSNSVRFWLRDHGIDIQSKALRSHAHLVEYFALGLILALLGRAAGVNPLWMIIAGCGLGLLDESLRILLPTREFDYIDLMKDWIGILASAGCVRLLTNQTERHR